MMMHLEPSEHLPYRGPRQVNVADVHVCSGGVGRTTPPLLSHGKIRAPWGCVCASQETRLRKGGKPPCLTDDIYVPLVERLRPPNGGKLARFLLLRGLLLIMAMERLCVSLAFRVLLRFFSFEGQPDPPPIESGRLSSCNSSAQ